MRVCLLTTEPISANGDYLCRVLASLGARFGKDQVCLVYPEQVDAGRIEGVLAFTAPPPKSNSWFARRRLRRALRRRALDSGAHTFHALDLEAARVAQGCARKRRGRMVYDCHGRYPYKAPEGFQEADQAEVKRERKSALRADCLLVPDENGETYFRVLCGRNVYVWRVGDYPDAEDMLLEEKNLHAVPQLVYDGQLDFAHSLREIMEALHILKQREMKFTFRLLGTLPPKERDWLDDYAKRYALGDVLDIPAALDPEARLEAIADADIGILAALDARERDLLPPSLLLFMRHRAAVVAPKYPPIEPVIEESGCGFFIDPAEPQDIANNLQKLLEDPGLREHMGRHGQHAIEDTYNWEAAEQVLFSAYAGMGIQ